jgi:TetR/AcrR family transcriptional regulator
MHNPLVDTMSLILERGQREGVFRSGLDPVDVYLTLSSMCYHILSNQYTLRIALNRNLGTDKAKSKWLDHIVDVICMYCVLEPVHRPSGTEKAEKPALATS